MLILIRFIFDAISMDYRYIIKSKLFNLIWCIFNGHSRHITKSNCYHLIQCVWIINWCHFDASNNYLNNTSKYRQNAIEIHRIYFNGLKCCTNMELWECCWHFCHFVMERVCCVLLPCIDKATNYPYYRLHFLLL